MINASRSHELISCIGADMSGLRLQGAGLPLLRLLSLWHHRCITRRKLAAMEPRLLCDIGLTAGEAQREAAMPFWQPLDLGRYRP
jgi:uncharacterized protein YjiS (DUF1127 family)